MKHIMVAVRDSQADAYMRPFAVPSVGMAKRSFGDEVNRAAADNQMYQHPEDFELFRIGEFDDVSGSLIPEAPTSLGTAKSFVITKG